MSRDGGGAAAQVMPGQEGYNRVEWVHDLSFKGVAGSVNPLHDRFYRMQKMLIEELTATFIDKAEFAGYKILKDQHRLKLTELWELKVKLNNNIRDIENLPEEVDLAQSAASLEDDLTDGVDQQYLIALVSDNTVFDDCDFYLESLSIKDVRDYLAGLSSRFEPAIAEFEDAKAKKYSNLLAIAQLESELDPMAKDIARIEKIAFKGRGVDPEIGMVSTKTFEASGDDPAHEIVIDYSKKSEILEARKISEKDKSQGAVLGDIKSGKKLVAYDILKQNMVIASFSFIVKYPNGYVGRASIPIRVGDGSFLNDDNLVNLEYFRRLSQFSDERYADEGLLLEALVKDKYLEGARTRGDVFFQQQKGLSFRDQGAKMRYGHSEQFTFAALEQDPRIKKRLVAGLFRELTEIEPDLSKFEILNMAIDMHTSRYMCDDCQTSAVGMQKNVKFLEDMKVELSTQGPDIKIDENCKVGVRASAACEFGKDIVTIPDHNFRSYDVVNPDRLLEMDVRRNAGMYAMAYSAKDMHLKAKLAQHTVFVSGMWIRDQFKEAYGKSILSAEEFAATKIARSFKEYREERQQQRVAVAEKVSEVMVSSVIKGVVKEAAKQVSLQLAEKTAASAMENARNEVFRREAASAVVEVGGGSEVGAKPKSDAVVNPAVAKSSQNPNLGVGL